MTGSAIPTDIQKAASEAANAFLRDDRCALTVRFGFASQDTRDALNDAIAAALIARDERCAQIAEGFPQTRDWVPSSLYASIRNEVAADIRNPKTGA